jgi:hypothetical protein
MNRKRQSKKRNGITIGRHVICRDAVGKVWLFNEIGEGGVFDEKRLAALISRFFNRNF